MAKVQVGYGSNRRGYGKAGQYGGAKTGKRNQNGGFNHCPTITFETVTDDEWSKIFPNGYKAPWNKQ